MQELQKLINKNILTEDENFALVSKTLQLINSGNKEEVSEGRNNVILVLEHWSSIPDNYKKVWADIIESVGFYPYLAQKQLQPESLDSKIRQHYHQSDLLNGKYLHSEQKMLSKLLLDKRNVIVSAPTSFGKSLLIEEIIASGLYKNIVVIQPTLALLDETRLKLKKYSSQYKIIVRTSQRPSEDKGNIFLLTAERVMEYIDMPKIELLILDEFYKLSNKRDDRRSGILNNAFIKLMRNFRCNFYLLGPNIDNISEGFAEKYNAVWFHTEYSLVFTDSDDRYNSVSIKNKGGSVEIDDLYSVLDELSGQQTLIFCSSPHKARELAFGYYQHLKQLDKFPNVQLPLIDWINENISPDWSLSKCLSAKIAVHDGAMQKHITTSTIHYFNDRKIDYLFCTTTIIEGVNTSAKNVVYYDNEIGSRAMDYFDYSNIKGRAGRLMEHYTGKIINLKEPPEKEATIIDIPFYDQDPIETEVLVHLDESDVKDINDNKARFDDFKKQDPELQEVLKKNGVSFQAQIEILNILLADLQSISNRGYIIWSGYPPKKEMYHTLLYIYNLCWNRLADRDELSAPRKATWLANKTVSYCINKSIVAIINEQIQYDVGEKIKKDESEYQSHDEYITKNGQEYQNIFDSVVERIFKVYRNWFQYKIPKWLSVVDSLQKYACKKLDMIAGDYKFLSDQIESEFTSDNLRILLEYGIPSSAVHKLETRTTLANYSEDEVVLALKKGYEKLKESNILSEYELDTIKRSI